MWRTAFNLKFTEGERASGAEGGMGREATNEIRYGQKVQTHAESDCLLPRGEREF